MFLISRIVFSPRNIAIQSSRRCLSQAGTIGTLSDSIKRDHQELKEYADNIRNANDQNSQAEWQNQFTWELARHSIAEELVVYPALERYLGLEGKQRADKDREEHQSVRQMSGWHNTMINTCQIKDDLYRFQDLSPADEKFLPTLDKLMKDLNEHIEEEEKHDLPILERVLDRSDSVSMANSFDRTKAFVPTRSHPWAPNKPPFETVVGLLAAPLDRLADLFRSFPNQNPDDKKASK